MWFQHDEFPAHFSANVRSALDTAYPGRWIGLGGPMYWLTCSLDLLLPRLLPLGPYQESCLRKPRRLQRGPGCEDCRHSRRYPEDARGYLLMFDSPSIDGYSGSDSLCSVTKIKQSCKQQELGSIMIAVTRRKRE
ncbi:uncharacterized protein TNCV_1520241 [Trichonephila clavipes]|nr:uncharacterized protein TNCV_1520241 [Trichonephila clavipes]